MRQNFVTSNSSLKPIRPRLHPITIGAGILLGSALVLINLYFCLPWWHLKCYMPWDRYEHGWPITYMVRDLDKNADMAGLCYNPWPFFDDPPLREFSPVWLAFDVVIALFLIVLTSLWIESWLRVRQVRLRFSLRSLLGIIGLVSVFCALLGHMVVRYSLDRVDVANCAFGFCPGIVVFLAVCLSAVFVTRSILRFFMRPKNGMDVAE